jgi:acyl-CoA synthetase (AMP-forming)/AMP-acid ligase II
MLGLMQQKNLLLSSVIQHAARWHPHGELVPRISPTEVHRTDYATIESRSRRLASGLRRLGVRHGDCVATMAWNGYRHLELYWAISGMGAVCHTVNPRLAVDDIIYVMTHARDSVLFADLSFAPLIGEIAPALAGCVNHIVMMAEPAQMPDLSLPPGITLHCYEVLMAQCDDNFEWPDFDENTASALCYTSGTTGRPKGVLYSHRSAVLHAMAINAADNLAFRAVDRIFMATSMYHATAWGWPYAAAMSGAALVMPGPWLDGATVLATLNDERITYLGEYPPSGSAFSMRCAKVPQPLAI